MNKICTNIEQSKKLIELGIDPNTADMYYMYAPPPNLQVGNPVESLKWYNAVYTLSGKNKPIELHEYCVPAWSLSALLELMPAVIEESGFQYCLVYLPAMFSLDYKDIPNMAILKRIGFKQKRNATLLDAAFEMICWLLENGYIKK